MTRFLDRSSKKWLADQFQNRAVFDEPMAAHTSFRVGGPAAAFVEPETLEDLCELISWAQEQQHAFLVVGKGTNLLVTDKGYDGIVISLCRCLNRIAILGRAHDRVQVRAMAGTSLSRLCAFAVRNGLKGMNFALGIPGTVGGAILMNAGTSYGWTADVLDQAVFLRPTGDLIAIPRKQLNFSYRTLALHTEDPAFNLGRPVIIEGRFDLATADRRQLKQEADEILAQRRAKQPLSSPSAGCFFKNPPSGQSAGELIEKAGLKGARVGGARVSPRHANFIVSSKKATATDILVLADRVRQAVWDKFNIQLENEVKIVGN